jgi:hypothetical protein
VGQVIIPLLLEADLQTILLPLQLYSNSGMAIRAALDYLYLEQHTTGLYVEVGRSREIEVALSRICRV